MRQGWLGELEHMLLLSIVRLGDNAYAPDIGRTLGERARRRVSRSALYSTLDRLEKKGFVRWTIEGATSERGGNRRRRFTVTPGGLAALRASHMAIRELAKGLGGKLAGSAG
jgi:DNA-binding PadR family transcriptional regulator